MADFKQLRDINNYLIRHQFWDTVSQTFKKVTTTDPLPVTSTISGTVTVDNGMQGTGASYNPPTGGAGLLGYLSAVSKKITDLIALFPTSLGIKTSANSLSVTPASDSAFNIASAATRSQITVTRPANTTAYTAGDVIGGVITFTSMGAAASMQMLTSVDLRIDIAAIPSGMSSLRLHFYNATPPSAYADNAAWDLPSGDRNVYIGYIDLGTPVDLGSTLFCQVDSANKQMKMGTGETSIYAYLVTTGGFTPAANSEVYVPTLRAVAL